MLGAKSVATIGTVGYLAESADVREPLPAPASRTEAVEWVGKEELGSRLSIGESVSTRSISAVEAKDVVNATCAV